MKTIVKRSQIKNEVKTRNHPYKTDQQRLLSAVFIKPIDFKNRTETFESNIDV